MVWRYPIMTHHCREYSSLQSLKVIRSSNHCQQTFRAIRVFTLFGFKSRQPVYALLRQLKKIETEN